MVRIAKSTLIAVGFFLISNLSLSAEKTTPETSLNLSNKLISSLANRWDTLLKKYVHPTSGLVNYSVFYKNDFKTLSSLIEDTSSFPNLNNLDDNTKKSLYLNLYNMVMIRNVFSYAIQNDIKDFQGKKFKDLEINAMRHGFMYLKNLWNDPENFGVTLAGTRYSLDNIEHGLIRAGAKDTTNNSKSLMVKALDPRIHAAANCAATSCPRLREIAYRPSNIDSMLDQNMKEFISNPKQFFISKNGTTLNANNIVAKWYSDDFELFAKTKGISTGKYLASFIDPNSPVAKNHPNLEGVKTFLETKFPKNTDGFYNWRINSQ